MKRKATKTMMMIGGLHLRQWRFDGQSGDHGGRPRESRGVKMQPLARRRQRSSQEVQGEFPPIKEGEECG